MNRKNIEIILSKMTLEEKIALCSGKNFWETKGYKKYGIPSMQMCDGPHGLRKQNVGSRTDMLGINESVPAICFPAEVTTAASWDINLLERVGSAIGQEAKVQNIGLVLGPGVNTKRNPLCGRNFEYFSEDPYLSGKLAAGFIRGMEGEGVGACVKHFACNSQEESRFLSDGVIDERTLRELYLTAFEIAVREGHPSAVMCAYPKVNGIHCSDYKKLLTGILRGEWQFEGLVVTDWGAMNDRIAGFQAGCDLNMPGGSAFMEKDVARAFREGKLSEALIDASASRILKMVYRAQDTLKESISFSEEIHHKLAVEAAEKGAVLLKNEDEILPVDESTESLAVIGYMAKEMRYQGAGSSHINPTRLSAPLDYFPDAWYAQGCLENGQTTDALLDEVRAVAQKVDKGIVFAGLPGNCECEGFDRKTMRMPEGHLRMIEETGKANKNTIVVLCTGSVVECPWEDQVKGILYLGLPGQGGAEAVYHLLTGQTNPSGKLAETWPYVYADVPSSKIYDRQKDALYEEGIYVGYRYYDKAQIPVRWPFGYGLSYTRFAYSDLQIASDGQKPEVSVTVTNTGKVFGEEVVQLYVSRVEQTGIHRPVRELKGFCKVALEAGEEKCVTFSLDKRSFAVWKDRWVVEAGTYEISVADLKCRIALAGETLTAKNDDSWYWSLSGKPDQISWEQELGRTYVPSIAKKGSFTMDNTIEEMMDNSLLMKVIYQVVEFVLSRPYGGKQVQESPEFKMMMKSSVGAPLRSMQMFSGIKGGLFEGLLEIANGHLLRGIVKMIKK